MGLIDRFRTSKQPAKKPRGESGRGHVDGYLQLDELNTDLHGERGLEVFDKMYWTDPDVRKNLWMIVNLLAGATWTVVPFGGDDATDTDKEAAEFVEWALFENMRPGWKGHLAEALPVGLRSGFAPFEHLWERTEWNGRDVLAPKKLDLRLPRTITRWNQQDGELVSIQQQLMSGEVTLPADDLLYYRFGAEGDNWEGRSMLRPAYKPWYLKDQIERLDAIKMERQAVGTPVCYPPKQATPDQLSAMEDVMINLRSGDQGYVLMPGPRAATMDGETGQEYGWELEILGAKQSESSDTKPSLDYHSDKIAAALLAEFMRLGQGGAAGGSRAVGEVQQNPFLQAAEALSAVVESVANDGLVARMVALNFEVDGLPSLVMSMVDEASLNDIATFVGDLVEKNVIHADNELEDFLRDRADLPPAEADARQQREETAKAGAEALKNAGNTPPKAPMDPEPPEEEPADVHPTPEADETPVDVEPPRWGRELRAWEMYMSLEEIDTAVTQARDRFQEAAGAEARAVAGAYAVAALAGKNKPKPGKELVAAIDAELQRLYRTGRSTVADELDRQRSKPAASPMVVADAEAQRRLKRRAQLAADSVEARIWQASSRSILQRGGDLPAAQAAAEAEAVAALKAEANLHASAALNEGRSDQADDQSDEIAGSRYTSILDTNRCAPCSNADDDVLRPLNDPVRLARKPPNPQCEGGDRCRCMEAFQLKEENPGIEGTPAMPAQVEPGGPTSSHFDVTGGDQALKDQVGQQMSVIDQVHRFPENLPRIGFKIGKLDTAYGKLSFKYDSTARTWDWQEITVDAASLRRDPPINSTVHEIGHFLDQWGFGDGPPHEAILAANGRNYLSGTDAMHEWRDAVVNSHSYRNLVLAGADEQYTLSIRELLARSYEQWIAEVSQDPLLLAKIAKRREDNVNLYWDTADFHNIAVAFDRFFTTRGLR